MSTYVPDKTGSSLAIVLSLALGVGLLAGLVGLSDKPDVDALVVSGTGARADVAGSLDAQEAPDDPSAVEGVELDELGQPIDDEPGEGASATAAAAGDTQPTPTAVPVETPTPDLAEAPVAIPTPTPEPSPTPEVAAAVEPTPQPSAEVTPEATQGPAEAATGPLEAGAVEGAFFTRPDEDNGAVVAQNKIEVSFNADGSGTFKGVLDIVFPDETHIYLDMSGPLVWTSGNPQVVATVTGTYGFDSAVDADDFASEEAELSITSLKSGSGSLCTPKCFGFTFPPQ